MGDMKQRPDDDIKCIFLCEVRTHHNKKGKHASMTLHCLLSRYQFHSTVGTKIVDQSPKNFITKDVFGKFWRGP